MEVKLTQWAIVLFFGFLPSVLAAESRRLALVIGNQTYNNEHWTALTTPLQDARRMSSVLSKAGFQATTLLDADKTSFDNGVKDFLKRVHQGDEVLIYYAGHGAEFGGQNYMIPVSVTAGEASQLPSQSISVKHFLLDLAGRSPRVMILILDACRNIPMGKGGPSDGLAPLSDAPEGTYIAFATAPGKTAQDNGLFGKHLAAELAKPGRKIDDIFNVVRAKVFNESGRDQKPWTESSLIGDYYPYPDGHAATEITPETIKVSADMPACGKGLQTNAREEGPLYIAAQCDMLEGHYADVVAKMNVAIQKNGKNGDYYFLRGLARRYLSQTGADGDFRKALETDPERPNYLLELGRTLLAAGNTDEASKFLQSAYAKDPKNRDICLTLASASEKTGASRFAEMLRQRAAKLSP